MATSLACERSDRVGDRRSHNRHADFDESGRLVVGGNHLRVPIRGGTDIRMTRYLWKFVCCATQTGRGVSTPSRARVLKRPVPIYVDEAMAADHTAHRKMVTELGAYRGLGTPIKLSRTSGGTRSAAPRFNEHGEAVLRARGFFRRRDRRPGARGCARAEATRIAAVLPKTTL